MKLEVWRCENCQRILQETNFPPGLVVKIKCGSCNTWNTMRIPRDGTIGPRLTDYEKRALG